MTHHPLIPLPFNPLPSTLVSFPSFPRPLPSPDPFPSPSPPPALPLPLPSPRPLPSPDPFPPAGPFLPPGPFSPPDPFPTPTHSLPRPILYPDPFPTPAPSLPPDPFPTPTHSLPLTASYVSPLPLPSVLNHLLTPSRTPPPPLNGSNFSMVVTISHINYPQTHLPRFTPSLFCYLISNFPHSHHFLLSTLNTSPGVYFDNSLINQFCCFFVFFKKLLCQHFSLPQQHPSTSHFISFPPSKISNSANFSIPNIISPHHDFFSPNFKLPTFLFHKIIYSDNVSPPPPLLTFHLPPLLTFLIPTTNLPTLLINQLFSKISPPTSLLHIPPPPPPPPNNIPSSSTIYYFCSVNSSSNIIHYTSHSFHTKFSIQNFI